MSQSMIQPSFAAGELAPALWSRVDLAKYHVGSKTLRNFFVLPSGGASNRPGTQFVGQAANAAVRLIPFQFNVFQTYILELTDHLLRIITNGGYVMNGATPFSLVTPWPADVLPYIKYTQTADVMTLCCEGIPTTPSSGHAPQSASSTAEADGTLVYELRRNGPTDHDWTLGIPYFTPAIYPPAIAGTPAVAAASGSGSVYYSYVVTALSDADESLPSVRTDFVGAILYYSGNQNVVNTIQWTPVMGAVRYRIYKAESIGQQGYTSMYGTGMNPIPVGAMYGYIGTATGSSFVDSNIAPDFTQGPPQGDNPFNTNAIQGPIIPSNGGSGLVAPNYALIDHTGGGAQLQLNVSGGALTSIDVPNGGQGWSWAQLVVFNGPGMGALLKLSWAVTTIANTTNTALFKLTGVTVLSGGSGYSANAQAFLPYGVGGSPPATITLTVSSGVITAASLTAGGGTGGNGTVYYSRKTIMTTNAPDGNGAYYYAPCAVVIDLGSANTVAIPTPVGQGTPNVAPGCCTYFQGRRVFGGGKTTPEHLNFSQSGSYSNFGTSFSTVDSDAISISIASRQINAIKHLVSVNALLALTASGAFKISSGSANGTLTPSQTIASPQAYNGCADVPPLIINNDILYVQARGSRVRDLSYNFYADVFTGADLTVLSPHLFFGHTILEWCYAEEPFNLVWAVRDDGIVLCLTYLKEQDVYAWSRHDFPGVSGTDKVLSIATISEGKEDAVYLAVSRAIPGINGGNPVTYVERFHSRNFLNGGQVDSAKAWFVDCGLAYNGSPVTVISGLDHLNGAAVSIIADGNVVPSQTVTNGAITLLHPASTVIVGLPYSADLQTLPMDVPGVATVQGKRKSISAVTLRLENTRGLKVGPDQQNLTEIKERIRENYGQPTPLITGDERVVISPSWNTQGSIWIRQDQPLPATILGIIPEGRGGDDG